MLQNQDGIPFAWYCQTAADVAKKVDEIYEAAGEDKAM